MLLRHSLTLLGVLGGVALGDIEFTNPTAGATLTGGFPVDVHWADSGDAPSIADLTSYQLLICAGSNDNESPACASLVDDGRFSHGNKAFVTVPVGLGESAVRHAYFFKIISKATTGDTVINFSDRFSLSHMTGVFPRKLADDLEAIPPPYHPRAKRQLANANPAAPAAGAGAPAPAVPGAPAAPAAAAPAPGAVAPAPAPAAPAAAGAAAFTMPYTLQTGLTKYAPMQPMPPTKITANNPTPLWPTSASTVATTWLPAASVVTTVTQSPSYSATSLANTASPAPMPSNDMHKFLARWKD